MRTLVWIVLLAVTVGGAAPGQAAPAKGSGRALSRLEAEALVSGVRDDLAGLLWWHTNELQHSGQGARVLPVCDLVTQLDPTFVESYSVGAWLAGARGRQAEVVARYRAGIAANPRHWQLYHELGLYYQTRRQPAQALPYLAQAVKLKPPAFAYRSYAHCLTKLGRRAEAIAAWQKVLALNPSDGVATREIERLRAAQKGT